MSKRYWYIMLVYILMQLSGFVVLVAAKLNMIQGEAEIEKFGIYWTIGSFIVGLLLTIALLLPDIRKNHSERDKPPVSHAIIWAIAGVFMAFIAQMIAGIIEKYVFHVDAGSENTKQIMSLVKKTPLLIIVVSLIGPILEEIIFRKIIFGSLYQRFNFFIAVIISSLTFALIHLEPKHILIYASMGLTFAFLYRQTKRILVPIFAHMSMNTLVVLIQYTFADKMEDIIKQSEKIQFIWHMWL